ncbi:MAG TPA: lanthionine synthetase LanC family protein [Thermoanaerobaculia bacterium]
MSIPLTRRDLLRLGATAGIALPLGIGRSTAAEMPSPGANYLDAALQAARWLQTTRVGTPQGLLWLNGPERPEGLISTPDLYSGNSGIVLFLLELAKATGDKAWLEEASAGASYLIATLPERLDPAGAGAGLYTGFAGLGFTLHRVYKETGDEKYLKAAVRCRDLIHAAAQPAGAGVQWGGITDIIAGAAGTGLYLLQVARETDNPASRDLAVRAGLRLVELGVPEAGGLKWRMDPEFKRLMPNFSHGTAGIAYFLATLHQETGRKEFLDAARAGARYLQSIASTQGDGCLIFHNEPEGKDLYYLSWCHGPVGTARLWVRLHQIDGKAGWLDWARKGAKSILASGVPEQKTPGFWNNAGQCCGSAGVAGFFLDLAKLTGDDSYRAHARRVVRDLLAHATATPGDGLKWIHAEHRIRPEYTYAQTGYMQGAAGIGMLLLQMDATEKGREWTFRLPDSPF